MNAARVPAYAVPCAKRRLRDVEQKFAVRGAVDADSSFRALRAAGIASGSAGSAFEGAERARRFVNCPADSLAGLPACEVRDVHRFDDVVWCGCRVCACCGLFCVRSWGSFDCGSTMVSKLPIIRQDRVRAFLEGIV